jgi:carbon dioxide concentrating mechanism protein CcmN
MALLPFQLEPISTTQSCVAGDVVLGEGVAIAPGVLLQADPGSRIVIGAGACLGLGCVIHAQTGVIEIGPGANLGAGVLVVGAAAIGAGALIGAGTTVFNQSIAPEALIPPSSLLVGQLPVSAPGPQEPRHTQTAIGSVVAVTFSAPVDSEPIQDPWGEPAAPTPTAHPKVPLASSSRAEASAPAPTSAGSSHTTCSRATFSDNVGAGPLHPDSDLSMAELQNPPPASPEASDREATAIPSEDPLAPCPPKQVYGQAYVHQMLGKMLGRDS